MTVNLKDVASRVGLEKIQCQCGRKIDGFTALKSLFKQIILFCRNGEAVRIANFGTFKAREIKGRTIKSPIAPVDGRTYGDMASLSFKQSANAKKMLNDN